MTFTRHIDHRLPSAMPKNFVDNNIFRSDVPCGTCQLCCKTLIVPLADEEYEKYEGHWGWVTTPDGKRWGRALLRNPDGSCVYLTKQGCSIHGNAPHVCQRFDCRELFRKSDRAGRREQVKSGKLPKALYDKGREMLKAADLPQLRAPVPGPLREPSFFKGDR